MKKLHKKSPFHSLERMSDNMNQVNLFPDWQKESETSVPLKINSSTKQATPYIFNVNKPQEEE